MISKKTITFILVGIAIAAVPFFQRMQEQQRAGWYINQIEEDGNEESEKTGSYKKVKCYNKVVTGVANEI